MEFYDEVPSHKAVEDMVRRYHEKCAEKAGARSAFAAQVEPEPLPGTAPPPLTGEPPRQAPDAGNGYIPGNGYNFNGEFVDEPQGYYQNEPQGFVNTRGDYPNFENDFNRDRRGGNCGCNDGCNNPCYSGNPCKRNCWRVSPRAVRLCQEIIDRMKDVRAIFIMLDRQGFVGYTREFNRLIGEKTANIRIMERVYECLTGFRPLDYRPDFYYIRGFCGGLRQAFLEQSAIIDKIAALNRLIPDPNLSRTVTAVGASELRSLNDINRMYERCR